MDLLLRRRFLLVPLLLSAALLSGCRQSTVHEVTILHFNDLHDRLLPDSNGLGGVAHLATLLKRERAAAHASLTLSAGDLVQGTPVSTLFHGVPDYEIANSLRIDVNCLGNHEFDYGWKKIHEFMEVANFTTISANVVDASGNRLLNPPYVIREAGGMRIAVIGALLQKIMDHTTQESLGPYDAAPHIETLRPIVAEAKQHADMVIVLGHIEKGEAVAILQGLPDVSLVVIGHEHTPWQAPIEVDGRFVVHAAGYGRQLGKMVLSYDTATRRIVSHEWTGIPVTASEYPADPAVQKQVDQWEAKVATVVDVPIGEASKHLTEADIKDQMEQAIINRFPADLAYINVTAVRDTFPQGQLQARQVWNVMPFDDRVVIADIPGDQLIKLEDSSVPAKVAKSFKIDPARTYRLVTIDFLTSSWSDRGYKFHVTDQGALLRDVLIDWIKQRRSIP